MKTRIINSLFTALGGLGFAAQLSAQTTALT